MTLNVTRRADSRADELVNITEDVRKYAAEQGIAEEEALTKGMTEKKTNSRSMAPNFMRRRDPLIKMTTHFPELN